MGVLFIFISFLTDLIYIAISLTIRDKLTPSFSRSVRNDININKTPNIKKFNVIFVLLSIKVGINAAKKRYALGFNNGCFIYIYIIPNRS